jgi:hypothetical protein
MKNPESNRIAEVGSQGHSMTWGELLQCRMVRVGVSQSPYGGWRKRQGTAGLLSLAFGQTLSKTGIWVSFCDDNISATLLRSLSYFLLLTPQVSKLFPKKNKLHTASGGQVTFIK